MKRQPKIITGTLREVSEDDALREALKWFKPTLTEAETAEAVRYIIQNAAKSIAWHYVQNRSAESRRLIKADLKREIESRALRAWQTEVGAHYDRARGKYLAACSIK